MDYGLPAMYHSQRALPAREASPEAPQLACSQLPWHKSVVHHSQRASYRYGLFVSQQWKLVLFFTLAALCLATLGVKDIKFEARFSQLWMSDDSQSAKAQDEELTRESSVLSRLSAQSLMQRSPPGEESVLTRQQLLAHLRLMERAVNMEVRVPGLPLAFTLEQLCHKYDLGQLELMSPVRSFMQMMVPCRIVTPLDCFWDGAKLLGPRQPVRFPRAWDYFGKLPKELDKSYRWTNLDPKALMLAYIAHAQDSDLPSRYPQEAEHATRSLRHISQILTDVGIEHGYTRRPCLDPLDPQCPSAASAAAAGARNLSAAAAAAAATAADVAELLGGGCAGFAERLLLSPVDHLVGGRQADAATGKLRSGRALLSTIMLKSAALLHDDYRRNQPLSDWSLDKVTSVVEAWREQFHKLVEEENARHPEPVFFTFNSNLTADAVLARATKQIHWTKWCLLVAGCIAYTMAVLFDSHSLLHSQLTVAFLTVPLVLLSVAASLGLTSWFRIPADILSVQILPFVQLGISSFYCLTVTNCYNHLYQSSKPGSHQLVLPLLCQRVLPPTLAFLLVSLAAPACALVAAPLAALRLLCLHWAVSALPLALLCLAGLPAALAADSSRRRRLGADLLCCRLSRDSPSTRVSINSLLGARLCARLPSGRGGWARRRLCLILAGAAAFAMVAAGGFAAWRLAAGADFDPIGVVPAGTQEHLFLAHHRELFSFSELVLRTKKLDYPRQQTEARRLFYALAEQPFAANRSQNPFWLDQFRDWLVSLQTSFDEDVRRGLFAPRFCSKEAGFNYTANASTASIMAAHLLIQTGEFDKFDFANLEYGRLVDRHGQVHVGNFYVYLTSWYSQSQLSYETANVLIIPRPQTHLIIHRDNLPQYIPRSEDIAIAQSVLQLVGLNSTRRNLAARASILEVSQRFRSQGVEHTLSGPALDFHSPDWLDGGRMAGMLAFLVAGAWAASLMLFWRLVPAVVCSCLCLLNLLQVAPILLAADVQLNLLTCTAVGLAFPVMYLINLLVVFVSCHSDSRIPSMRTNSRLEKIKRKAKFESARKRNL